jgi:hypothetical protein
MNSIQSLKSQYMTGVHNIEPGRHYSNPNHQKNSHGADGVSKKPYSFSPSLSSSSSLPKNNSRFGKVGNYKKQNTHA